MFINFNPSGRPPKGILAQLLTLVLGALVLGAAFMFSLVFFAILAVAGLILWLYFWWKTRLLRKQIRERMLEQRRNPADQAQASSTPSDGDIIEGEAVRVDENRD